MAREQAANSTPKTEEEDEIPLTTPEDARKLSATYADTYFIGTWSGHVRLTFGEVVDESEYYHVAVVLPLDVVESLLETLTRMTKEQRARDAKGS